MTELQKQKICWLSRAFEEEQLLSAMLSVQEQQKRLLHQKNFSKECSLLILQLEMLQKEIHQQSIELALIREEIRTALEQLSDPSVRAVCLRKYLAYETNEQIANAMSYDVRTIQRKHKKALDALQILP